MDLEYTCNFAVLFILKSFLAFDEDFCENELTIPEVDQLVSWDEGKVQTVSLIVIKGHVILLLE